MKKLIPILTVLSVFCFQKLNAQVTSVLPTPQSVTICEGDATTINFSPTGTCTGNYEYQVLNGATVVQAWSTTTSYNASNIVGITYTVELRCSNSPGTVVTDTFLVDVVAEPTITGNLTICSGDSAALTASGSTPPLEWWDNATGGTQLSNTANYTTPNITTTTTYYTQGSGISSGGGGTILITECGLEGYAGSSSADYIEVSNLYSTAVNTTGWTVAVSGSYSNINTVNSIEWSLPNSFNACSVVSKNDVSSDPNYWGSNILWNPGNAPTYNAWAIIIDDLGNVVDFVCWGWTAADLVGFNPTINGFPITLGPEWTGNGVNSSCGVAGGPQLSIQRTGNNDNNNSGDFVCAATTVDVVNPGMLCGWSPLTCRFPVTVTVEPTPTVTVPANATYCDGDNVPATNFISNPAGGTFTWTNSNTTIGLGANGTGDIATFTATNTTNAPIIATITVTPNVNGCEGTPSSYTITVNPTPAAPTALSVNICANNSTTLTATAPGGTYEWYDAATNGSLIFTGAGYTTPVLASDTSFWVQTTLNGCVSPRTQVDVTIAATLTVNAGLDDTICNGQPYNLNVSPNGVGYAFDWNYAANPSFSAIFNPVVNPTTTTTYWVTVTDPTLCTGNDTVVITVIPTSTVAVPAAASYCHGDNVPATNFVNSPVGGTFSWTNSNTAIGIPASGNGNIATFAATNTTGAPITATITVTPDNGCLGTPSTYTITVNPTPTVTVTPNNAYCNGDPVLASAYVSAPAGGTFTWTNSNPAIGLAANGTGNTPAFTATNTSGNPITGTINVTPTANSCAGTPSSYTITVNPTPTVIVTPNLTYCNGDLILAGAFTSTPSGATYTWTNSDPTIGLAANGTGNTPAFTAANASGAPIIATVTVTPTANNCPGTPSSYTITINPGATANVPANITECVGTFIPASNFSSVPAGGTFSWTNSDPTIGLAAAGTGNIPAFTATNTTNTPIVSTVSVTATANGCPGNPSTFTITINPIVTASNNVAICPGDSVLIGGTYIFGAGSYSETLTSSYGCDSILTTNLTINVVPVDSVPISICSGDSTFIEGNFYDSSGVYTFNYTSSVGCDSIIIYNLTVNPLPSFNINVTGTTFINLGESVDLAVLPGVPGTSYSWDPPAGLNCIFCQNPTATPLESTWYFVTVTNAQGCQIVDSVYIEVDPSSNIYVPNIFSPNGAGDNNIYYVRGKGIQQFNLMIFNRWGQIVFESTDIENGWDGTTNGSPLNQGVFVYKLDVTFYSGETFNQTGNITLIR